MIPMPRCCSDALRYICSGREWASHVAKWPFVGVALLSLCWLRLAWPIKENALFVLLWVGDRSRIALVTSSTRVSCSSSENIAVHVGICMLSVSLETSCRNQSICFTKYNIRVRWRDETISISPNMNILLYCGWHGRGLQKEVRREICNLLSIKLYHQV